MNKDSASTRQSEVHKFVGLDVHKETIAIAVADSGIGAPRSLGTIANDLDALRKALRRIGSPRQLRVCYEAGPCGYVIYRFLERLKIDCMVIAPSLIPRKPGNRIKTDRRDAEMLARLLRSGELTATWVPGPEDEALRDVLRAREDAVEDHLRAVHRLSKFLLRLGIKPANGVRRGTVRYRQWLRSLRWENLAQQLVFTEYCHSVDELEQRIVRFEKELPAMANHSPQAATIAALQALRGFKVVTASTIVSEVGDVTRFATARQLMAYAGMVPSEHSSGNRSQRGSITKCGNAHLRRVAIEAAWHYRHYPGISEALRKRQAGIHPMACASAWNAQQRLHKRFKYLEARGKRRQTAVVAVARELLGFVWAIGQIVKQSQTQSQTAA